MIAIFGQYYVAVSTDNTNWLIKRGRFEMGRFTGTPDEMAVELNAWDSTVETARHQRQTPTEQHP